MSEQHPHRATILPVPEGIPRPLWSVMIPTYNCANYLRESLASVLAQDPGADIMQIEVVDDYSTKDDPEAIVREIAGDRVNFYRQPENVGYIKNFETCLQRSRGKLIHLLHGDDCVKDGFYCKLQHGFEKNPYTGAAFCRHIHMDEQGNEIWISSLEQPESGILNNWLKRIAVRQLIQTPSIVVRRDVYERLGGFDYRMSCWGEDWEMWVRIAAYYPVWYEVEPLALYRQSSTSLTGQSLRTGKNIQDFRKAIEITKKYLPNDSVDELSGIALKNYAFYSLDTANKFISTGDIYGAINQLKEALKCHSSIPLIRSSIKLSTKIFYLIIISGINRLKLTNP
ncbi:glycosyltransferase [Dolichospermum planctonicum UHCC 0167]|jgi:glycosyltransferase involved in cell wall biosynthesis|uniref:glycosyltransferase family 2 protein n=1 Tax=Dolichospermum planctonicum TaxID=136072 RepID=UPI001443245C|nr:glycosyltransferase family 2 protein [Dolichospermum planctonicum]MCW9682202.1 glycosyltransferase [Dolichospermum planctonicum UHCC 0167]